jgi:hypothetical protein
MARVLHRLAAHLRAAAALLLPMPQRIVGAALRLSDAQGRLRLRFEVLYLR